VKQNEAPSNTVGNSPDFFIKDFSMLAETLSRKASTLGAIELNDLQKAQFAGSVLKLSLSFQFILNKLKEWGYMA